MLTSLLNQPGFMPGLLIGLVVGAAGMLGFLLAGDASEDRALRNRRQELPR